MASEKFRELVSELLRATKSGRSRWAETDSPKAFRLTFSKGTVVARTWVDRDDDPVYGASLQNPEGREIDVWEAYGGDDFTTLQEFWALARASALDVDGVIDGIMKELEKDVPF